MLPRARSLTSAPALEPRQGGSESVVESDEPFVRSRSVASRQGIKHRVELGIQIEPMSETAEPDDFGP
jgi:hypothetical protein